MTGFVDLSADDVELPVTALGASGNVACLASLIQILPIVGTAAVSPDRKHVACCHDAARDTKKNEILAPRRVSWRQDFRECPNDFFAACATFSALTTKHVIGGSVEIRHQYVSMDS